MQLINFTGLYRIKTHPERDWLKDPHESLGSGMKLVTIHAKDLFPDDEFVVKTNQYSTYAGLDTGDVLVVKTPDYVPPEVQGSIVYGVLEKLGLKELTATQVKKWLPLVAEANETFDVTEYMPDLITLAAIEKYLNLGDMNLLSLAKEKDSLDFKLFPYVSGYLNDDLRTFSNKLEKLLVLGFDINGDSTKRLNGLPHRSALAIGPIYLDNGDLAEKPKDFSRLNHLAKLKLLKDNGADFSVENKKGETVWEALGISEQKLNEILDSDFVKDYVLEQLNKND